MRLTPLSGWLAPRRRDLAVRGFDEKTGVWTDVGSCLPVDRDQLTVTTYNIWNDTRHARERYLAIAEHLSRCAPDVMVFQEVTERALDVFTGAPWIRRDYMRTEVVGGDAGNYGMLLLSRLPVRAASYTRLPTRQSRGYLQAELAVDGAATVVCCIHLDSGKSSRRLRSWQLRRVSAAMKAVPDAMLMGDFNMRDDENARIPTAYRDLWPALRPADAGFTEDTSINLMRYDMKDKHRHVRFDRILLKGRRWVADDIELLGREPISADLPRVFPSDHFGVLCRLRRRSP